MSQAPGTDWVVPTSKSANLKVANSSNEASGPGWRRHTDWSVTHKCDVTGRGSATLYLAVYIVQCTWDFDLSDYGDCYIGSGDDNEEEENDDDVRRGRLAVHGTLTWQLFYLEGAVVSHSRALGDRPTVYNPRRPESKGANSYKKQETNLRKRDPPTRCLAPHVPSPAEAHAQHLKKVILHSCTLNWRTKGFRRECAKACFHKCTPGEHPTTVAAPNPGWCMTTVLPSSKWELVKPSKKMWPKKGSLKALFESPWRRLCCTSPWRMISPSARSALITTLASCREPDKTRQRQVMIMMMVVMRMMMMVMMPHWEKQERRGWNLCEYNTHQLATPLNTCGTASPHNKNIIASFATRLQHQQQTCIATSTKWWVVPCQGAK